jgi:hypothetical protein
VEAGQQAEGGEHRHVCRWARYRLGGWRGLVVRGLRRQRAVPVPRAPRPRLSVLQLSCARFAAGLQPCRAGAEYMYTRSIALRLFFADAPLGKVGRRR